MKILLIGPSPYRAQGGMATVLKDILQSEELNKQYELDMHESYIGGTLLKRVFFSFYAYCKFKTLYQSYDIFHIHMASYTSTFRKGYYVRFLKRHGKKVLLHIHGGEYLKFYNGLTEKKRRIVDDIWKKSDLIIVLSEEWKSQFDKIFDSEKIVVLNNGIDVEAYSAAITSSEDHKDTFLMLGRLEREKGVYDLVEAMDIAVKSNPKIKLFIAGDGEKEKVQNLIKEKGLSDNIKLVGWLNFEEKLELMKNISTVILPSHGEGLPMSILEGMAAGKAIISTAVGAIPEVVSEENGILFQPEDVEALAQSILKCSLNPGLLLRMSENNMQKMKEQYDMKKMHEKLAAYYAECNTEM